MEHWSRAETGGGHVCENELFVSWLVRSYCCGTKRTERCGLSHLRDVRSVCEQFVDVMFRHSGTIFRIHIYIYIYRYRYMI